MIIKELEFPVIKYHFKVFIYKERQELEDYFKKHNIQNLEGFSAGVFEIEEEGQIFFERRYIKGGIIAHECNHLINQAFNWIRYTPDPYNDEMQSYFLEWAFDQIEEIAKK